MTTQEIKHEIEQSVARRSALSKMIPLTPAQIKEMLDLYVRVEYLENLLKKAGEM